MIGDGCFLIQSTWAFQTPSQPRVGPLHVQRESRMGSTQSHQNDTLVYVRIIAPLIVEIGAE